MSSVRELHNKAMTLAQLALVARHKNEVERAEQLARQAYEYEAQAAALVPDDKAAEPTRSILYRSAASLAFQCREWKQAQRLIAKGLSGYPPPDIEQELKRLYEQVNFYDYINTHEVELEDEELLLTLKGNAVGLGTIAYKEFIDRIDQIKTLIDRTVQRLMGLKYKKSGRPSKNSRPFIPLLSAPRSGSFEISFKLARSKNQQMPLFFDASEVINQILVGIELVNEANEEKLGQIIKGEYYQNFIALTKGMAPDGERVTHIGFASKQKTVSLTRVRDSIELVSDPEESKDDLKREHIRIEGSLDYAVSRKQNMVCLTTKEGKTYKILIGEGIDDLARSYFGQSVIVKGDYDKDKKHIHLIDIQPSDN